MNKAREKTRKFGDYHDPRIKTILNALQNKLTHTPVTERILKALRDVPTTPEQIEKIRHALSQNNKG